MNWNQYLPTDGDVQVSRIADFLACGSYSAIHIAEMLTKKWTGEFGFYSERALAKLSGTTHQGNTLQNIVDAINKYGLIKDVDWPQINTVDTAVTWDEYYAEIPSNILAKADRGWTATLTKLSPSQVNSTLNISPVWTIIDAGTTKHIVAQINPTQYFDSYQIFLKNFQSGQPIVSQWFLKLKYNPMTNVQFIKNGDTNEFAFYVPAMSEDALKDKALNFGVNIFNPDGSINYNNAKKITGI